MQKLAEICIRRPVFASMIVLSLVVVGAAGFFQLGVDRFPSVDLPTVSVRTGLPGAAPEEVESLITQQIEEVVNTVDGIDELRSISGQGNSIVIATLDRKSTRLNSSHGYISYAVFCLKKKNISVCRGGCGEVDSRRVG